MQRSNVHAKPVIERTVHDGTGLFALPAPLVGAIEPLAVVNQRRGAPRNAPPLAGRVQRAWETGKQVRLQDDLLDPFNARVLLGARQLRADIGLTPRGDHRGEPDERALFVAQGRYRNAGRRRVRHPLNAGANNSTQVMRQSRARRQRTLRACCECAVLQTRPAAAASLPAAPGATAVSAATPGTGRALPRLRP